MDPVYGLGILNLRRFSCVKPASLDASALAASPSDLHVTVRASKIQVLEGRPCFDGAKACVSIPAAAKACKFCPRSMGQVLSLLPPLLHRQTVAADRPGKDELIPLTPQRSSPSMRSHVVVE